MKSATFKEWTAAIADRLGRTEKLDIWDNPMIPPFRRKHDLPQDKLPRKAAVLVLLYPDDETGEVCTAYMKRPEDGYTHGGQISFPGGKEEKEDKDMIDTALREAEEEFGLQREQLAVIGTLEQMYIPPSNMLVLPVVAVAEKKPVFTPDPKEVAAIIETPISYLLSPERLQSGKVRISGGTSLKEVPFYDLYGEKLWGATAMMTAEFLHHVRSVNGD